MGITETAGTVGGSVNELPCELDRRTTLRSRSELASASSSVASPTIASSASVVLRAGYGSALPVRRARAAVAVEAARHRSVPAQRSAARPWN